jgi:hypothetical protein
MHYYTTTIEQFTFYKDFAERAFNYLCNRICKYNQNIRLIVDYSDFVRFTLANFKRPNIVMLHIDNVVAAYGNANRVNEVCSLIIIALTHELHHAEQELSQERYRTDFVYKDTIEDGANSMAYHFLAAHRDEINRLFNINLDLSYLESIGRLNTRYHSSTLEGYYKNILRNVWFRNDELFGKFEREFLDKYPDVYLSFDNLFNLHIKSNGEFCERALNDFLIATEVYCGRYDRYTMEVYQDEPYRDKSEGVVLRFKLSDMVINPFEERSPS